MTAPIDRESVDRLANDCNDARRIMNECNDFPTGQGIFEDAERTLLALRAALDEAEARADRAAQEARVAALQEAARTVENDAGEFDHPATHYTHGRLAKKVLALIDTPAAEALAERGRRVVSEAEARGMERAAQIAETRWRHWARSDPHGEVTCDVTACENIAAAIRAQKPTPQSP